MAVTLLRFVKQGLKLWAELRRGRLVGAGGGGRRRLCRGSGCGRGTPNGQRDRGGQCGEQAFHRATGTASARFSGSGPPSSGAANPRALRIGLYLVAAP